MKRKKHMSQDQKEYNAYLMNMRHKGVPSNQTVVFWYFKALRNAGVDPTTVKPDDPKYGQEGSVILPEEALQPEEETQSQPVDEGKVNGESSLH